MARPFDVVALDEDVGLIAAHRIRWGAPAVVQRHQVLCPVAARPCHALVAEEAADREVLGRRGWQRCTGVQEMAKITPPAHTPRYLHRQVPNPRGIHGVGRGVSMVRGVLKALQQGPCSMHVLCTTGK